MDERNEKNILAPAVTRSSDKIELECVLDMCGDLRIGFLRFSTIKKCPHLLRLDHRELR